MSYMRMAVIGLMALVLTDYTLLDRRIMFELRDTLKAAAYEFERTLDDVLR